MKGKRLAATAFVLCSFAAACGSDDSSDETGTPETTASSPSDATGDVALDPDAEIRILTPTPPPGTWDPAASANPTQDVQFYAYVYDTLLRLNENNELEPQLATAWEYDATRTALTLTLRDDVTFTDGSQFTADVAKANLDRVRAGTGGAARLLAGIESIEVQSPTQLVINQTGANVKLLFALASTAASMVSPLAIEDPEGLAQNPVGSGPYLLDAVDPTTATYVRNDDYWNTDVVYAARHVVSGAVDGNARINAALSGAADFIRLSNIPPTPDLISRVDDGSLQMLTVATQPSVLGINNNVAPFDNPKVIEAINYAIDRETFNEVVYNGLCQPMSQVFVEGQVGYIEGLEYEYDVEKARELMEEAGVGDVTISFQFIAGSSTNAAELLQAMLAEIGITVEVELSPIQEVFPNFFSGRFAMSSLQLFLSVPDPSYVTDYVSGPLNPGTKDPALVEMVDAANAMDAVDPGRAEAYEEINRYVFENPVMVPLCQVPNTVLADPDVVGIDHIPFASIGGMELTRLGVRAQ